MMSDNRISYSVGAGGVNQYADVKKMQKLLITKGISVGKWGDDGHCGPYTILAIKKFQAEKRIMVKPDGRIDKDGKTWKILTSSNPNVAGNASVNPLATAAVMAPASQPQVVSTPLSSGGNVAKLIQVMEFITKSSLRLQVGTTGPTVSDHANNKAALRQRARNCDSSHPFTNISKPQSSWEGLCLAYVKYGLWAADYTNSYPGILNAKDFGPTLLSMGFTNIATQLFTDPSDKVLFEKIPDGAVIIYKPTDSNSHPGHIEVWSANIKKSYSDYKQANPVTNIGSTATDKGQLLKSGHNREVIGIWIKS
jgi:hypothetical protein